MTPACIDLDRAGVDYSIHPYEHDRSAPSYGLEAAEALEVSPERVFKTLMASLDTGELVVAIIAVTDRLDLKRLARAAGTKRAAMAELVDAERSSGYVAGGISPFGQRNSRRTFLDDAALRSDTIYVSGGRRGLDIGIRPADLVDHLSATVTNLAHL